MRGLLALLVATFALSACSVAPDSPAPLARPIVLTTDDDLALLVSRVTREPQNEDWTRLRAQADAARVRDFEPEQLADHEAYFAYALKDAKDVRALALAYVATANQAYLKAADRALAAWARDALLGETPGRDELVGQGLVIGRVMTVFADAYAILALDLAPDTRDLVERWMRVAVGQIMDSRSFWHSTAMLCNESGCGTVTPPWINGQFSNHLSAQNMGLLALAYALDDESLVAYAIDSDENDRDLHDMIDGAILMTTSDAWPGDPSRRSGAPDVEPGEMWDRLRIGEGRGLHYAHIQLRFLTIQALMARNNDEPVDWFAYVGPRGQSLRLAFDYYAEFLISGDAGSHSGYYSGDEIDWSMAPLYWIAHREYPDSAPIHGVIASMPTVEDFETFGWTLALTRGALRDG